MKVEIVLSIVLASSTVIYTLISLFLWVESRASRKQKTTPLMIAYLKTTENHEILTLHIKNIGEGLAKNVKINVIKDFARFERKDLTLSEIGIVKNGFNIFPPQYDLCFYIHEMTELKPEEDDSFIEIQISYQSSSKSKFKDVYRLPFNQITDQNYSKPSETFIGQIPYYLKEINTTLNKMIENQKEPKKVK